MGALMAAVLMMLCVCLTAGLMGQATAVSQLVEGTALGSGESLEAGGYRLVMEPDCNLVLFDSDDHPVWSSQTRGDGKDCSFVLQDDGNAIVSTLLNGVETAVWSSEYLCCPFCCVNDEKYVLVLQEDGNVVSYNGDGKAVWATGTNGRQ